MDKASKTEPAQQAKEISVSSLSIPFKELGYFSKIIIDYLDEVPQLKPFYKHPVSFEGIAQSINERKKFNTDRQTLTEALHLQYEKLDTSDLVRANIARLKEHNTFTVTTAHQPNIFTGYLYFVYKILHTIKLCAALSEKHPDNHFVPVYYMGSEDADLDELGNIYLEGEKIVWPTDQKGAVGKMKTKGLEKLIERIEGELGVLPFGNQLSRMLKKAYSSAENIQTATLHLVNELFSRYGLVVLIPDSPILKRKMQNIFLDDLMNQTASSIVEKSIEKIAEHYKVQANPREINLFYLKDNLRERIVKTDESWRVIGTQISFTEDSLRKEVAEHPERFSPNVILRGLFQETVLPNLVFIGGGGELAYWLELKDLFEHYQTPFPVLMLRNSFLIIEQKWNEKMQKLGIDEKDLFKNENDLRDELVKRDSSRQLDLEQEIQSLQSSFKQVKSVTSKIDKSLDQHIEALQARAVAQLKAVEKKMLRAEKKKFASQLQQLRLLHSKLFPNDNLQERVDNFMPYYAKYGAQFIEMLYNASPGMNKNFLVLTQQNS